MDKTEDAKIREIKSKVNAMLQERSTIASTNGRSEALPSKYWSDFCSYFEYLIDLPERYFANLRLHTFHLTGDHYQHYYFGDKEVFKEGFNLEALESGLPPKFILNELAGGIGHRYENGRFISADIARYQRVIRSLYHHKIFLALEGNKKKRLHVLEVGGGYGGLAHHLSNLLGDATYFIIDLPETLLFSASYISLHNPQKRIYLYDKETFQTLLQTGELATYDFVLIPNYQLRALDSLSFDLAVNVASLQEMRTKQAEEYLDFIQRTCKGFFYSWNEDRQPMNQEMTNVSELLRQRFSLIEVTKEALYFEQRPLPEPRPRRLLRTLATFTRVINRPAKRLPAYTTPRYEEYICRPLQITPQQSNGTEQ